MSSSSSSSSDDNFALDPSVLLSTAGGKRAATDGDGGGNGNVKRLKSDSGDHLQPHGDPALISDTLTPSPSEFSLAPIHRIEIHPKPFQNSADGNTLIYYLDGYSLDVDTLVQLSKGENKSKRVVIDLSEEAWRNVYEGRQVVDKVLQRHEVAYGINTGFGNFANVIIPRDDLSKLQLNLIRSHAAGVGAALSAPLTRMLLILRINVLAKGHSGIRSETLKTLLAALNANALPRIPCQGTVGASGDLAPLAHLALGMLGEGDMRHPLKSAPEFHPAAEVLRDLSIAPITLTAKEGLALINGTQLISAIGAEALVRSKQCCRQADVVASLTIEALRGSCRPFHPAIHYSRPHAGQQVVAGRLRDLLAFYAAPSSVTNSHAHCGRVQDSYTLRCIPQIHGIANDTVKFVEGILNVECNSATDNPMIFSRLTLADSRPHHRPSSPLSPNSPSLSPRLSGTSPYTATHSHTHDNGSGVSAAAGTATAAQAHKVAHSTHCTSTGLTAALSASDASSSSDGQSGSDFKSPDREGDGAPLFRGVIMSGGNFHGEYPAKSLDFLAIGVHELAAVSERRIERLVNPHLSALPAFLVKQGGLNSGFMIAHCTAAALVSENKGLCHPASVDSISTSAAQEDHVSMGGWAARKALNVVENVENVLAIELLAGCQAIDLLRPLKTTPPLEAVYQLVRSHVKPWDEDRIMSPDIEAVAQLIKKNLVWETVKQFIHEEYHDV